MSGAILAVLLILTVYDEDVITVEHVITAITVLGGILAASRLVQKKIRIFLLNNCMQGKAPYAVKKTKMSKEFYCEAFGMFY